MAKNILCVLLTAYVICQVQAISVQEASDTVKRWWSSFSTSLENLSNDSRSICKTDGVFPNPFSCNSYIHCSNGRAEHLTCPEDKHYSQLTQQCEEKCVANCDPSIACQCGWSSCATTFSISSMSQTSQSVENFVCKEDGLYKNQRNCGTFIQCSSGRASMMECPANLHFSEVTKRCEYPCDAKCDHTLACHCKWETCSHGICFLPQKIGFCKKGVSRWFYDIRTSQCKHFIYGGCGGNKNNFETKQECESLCINPIPPKAEVHPLNHEQHSEDRPQPDCSSSPETGSCLAKIPRYFYDEATEQCKVFIYGGCGGNGNNYITKRQCYRKCKPPQNESELTAIEDKSPVTEYISDDIPNSDCSSPPETGHCKARVPRYYYDARTGQCKRFIYGGCGGNRNNYLTESQCYQQCVQKERLGVTAAKIRCIQNGTYPDMENCSNSIICYTNGTNVIVPCPSGQHYNLALRRCTAPCDAFCEPSIACQCGWPTCHQAEAERDICRLTRDPGPCRSYTWKYFFNFRTGQCERFMYGGCGGNANNFKTLQECEQKCLRRSSPLEMENRQQVTEADWPEPDCSSPPEKGPCRRSFTRYYYDEEEGECKTFTYGGCQGNRNKYITKGQCERSCKKEESSEFHCPLPNGMFPVPHQCKFYYKCHNSRPIMFKCPEGQAFDTHDRECIELSMSDCNEQ